MVMGVVSWVVMGMETDLFMEILKITGIKKEMDGVVPMDNNYYRNPMLTPYGDGNMHFTGNWEGHGYGSTGLDGNGYGDGHYGNGDGYGYGCGFINGNGGKESSKEQVIWWEL